MMETKSLYRSKLTTPADAVGRIASGATLSMGMAMTEPPALLKALADRATAGKVDDLKIYYFESTRIAGESILRYELADRIHPYCMFVTDVERALIKKGMQDGGRKVLTYVPSNFHQSTRLLSEHIGIDTFLVTVAEFGGTSPCRLIGGGHANPIYAAFWHTALVRYVDLWTISWLKPKLAIPRIILALRSPSPTMWTAVAAILCSRWH